MFGVSRLVATAATLIALILLLVAPSSVLAHEHRPVGKYEFVVGWSVEPAFVGEKNGIDLRVTHKTEGGHGQGSQQAGQQEQPKPVEGLEKTLKAEIVFGGQNRVVELRPVFRQPGRYTADIEPTKEGDYKFRFFGTVEGIEVNETFDSADGKFNGVQSIQAIQFPETVPPGSELAGKVSMVEQKAASAQSAADSAQIMGIVGIAAGVLGVLVGGVALVRSGQRARTI